MKHAAAAAVAFIVRLGCISVASCESNQDPTTAAEIPPCAVAVSISGDVRSFVDPVVHRSFRRHVLKAIKAEGCSVDVFVYASLGDEDLLEEQDAETIKNIEATMEFLSPTQLVWHQEQAGIIPNSCRPTATTPPTGGGDEAQRSSFAASNVPNARHTGGNVGGDKISNQPRGHVSKEPSMPPSREQFSTRSERFYWQLYESLAAYRLAVQREDEKEKEAATIPTSLPASSKYDWIVTTRFDVAWKKSLPSLRAFSRDVVWFAAKSWPMSTNFALVPRAFSDRFFSAVEAFHACDDGNGPSWPPGEAWWQPGCGEYGQENGNGSGNVHSGGNLHHSPRGGPAGGGGDFELRDWDDGGIFHDNRGGGRGEGFGESIVYRHLHASGVPYRPYPMFEYYAVPPYVRDGDVDGGVARDTRSGCEASTSDYFTGCVLLGTVGLFSPAYTSEECATALSEWSSLHCRASPQPEATGTGHQTERASENLNPDLKAWPRSSVGVSPGEAKTHRGDVFGTTEADPVQEEDLQHAWSNLVALRDAVILAADDGSEEVAHGSSNAGEDDTPRGETSRGHLGKEDGGDHNAAPKPSDSGPTRQTNRSWSVHSQGGCRLNEYPRRAPHIIRHSSTDSHRMRELALATKCLAHRLIEEATAWSSVIEDFGFDATVCASSRSLELVMIDVSLHSAELGVCTADGRAGLTDAEHITRFFADPAKYCVGYGRLVLPPPPDPCPKLMVQAMEVRHPKEGAVYWEGPVNVDLEVTLSAGPGVEGLDISNVHVCADTDISWPLLDRSRSCVSLQQLASSDQDKPYLVFGTAIGVVEGTVSIRDARPTCTPPGDLRGPVLAMEDNPQEFASTSMRFKVIHHESMFRRRGKPFGPAPFGRGFATTQEYIQELEREADEELGAALDATERFVNTTHPPVVQTGKQMCSSRLVLEDRVTSLFASAFQLDFHIDQISWMLSTGRLPPEMAYAIDSLKEVKGLYPTNSAGEDVPGVVLCLGPSWRPIGSFFQKALVLPAPSADNVASLSPLQTWEYDEIPWMEALNPNVDWNAVEEAYLGNGPVEIVHIDGFLSQKALATLLDIAHGSSIFVDVRENYLGAYLGEGMSHPLLYQIAEEAAVRLPRILGRDTPGWPLAQTWFYIYGGNDGERCTRGIRVHADTAEVNLNIWLTDDSANLGSVETDDGGGLTVFHAKPPGDWGFQEFNQEPDAIQAFLEANDAGNTSVPYRQNRALMFDSMLFHQSDPFRFKKGFKNRRLNLTLLFGRRGELFPAPGHEKKQGTGAAEIEVLHEEHREVAPWEASQLRYCI
ncbi:unnamed protein product [Ectocarpus sp. 12 AP-2014]